MNLPPIPEHLTHLHRLGNFAVPWITEWTTTGDIADNAFGEHRPAHGPTVGCNCTPGEGKPAFAEVCYDRQRKAMEVPLCGVCGKELEAPYVWTKVGDQPYWQEPPNHGDCFAYALTACPHLQAMAAANPEFKVIEAAKFLRFEERTDNPDGSGDRNLVPESAPLALRQRLGYLRNYVAEPLFYTVFEVESWLRRQRKRERRAGSR